MLFQTGSRTLKIFHTRNYILVVLYRLAVLQTVFSTDGSMRYEDVFEWFFTCLHTISNVDSSFVFVCVCYQGHQVFSYRMPRSLVEKCLSFKILAISNEGPHFPTGENKLFSTRKPFYSPSLVFLWNYIYKQWV